MPAESGERGETSGGGVSWRLWIAQISSAQRLSPLTFALQILREWRTFQSFAFEE
jgi:hypothetical protein